MEHLNTFTNTVCQVLILNAVQMSAPLILTAAFEVDTTITPVLQIEKKAPAQVVRVETRHCVPECCCYPLHSNGTCCGLGSGHSSRDKRILQVEDTLKRRQQRIAAFRGVLVVNWL